jgi:hypothetical protein
VPEVKYHPYPVADFIPGQEQPEKIRSPGIGCTMGWMRRISSDDRFLKSPNSIVEDFNRAKNI